jgi:hypothetical protein
LQDKHPQFNTHSFYEYKKPKISVLQSYTILTQRNNLESYTQDICILFMVWCTIFDIKIDLTNILGNDIKQLVPNIFFNLLKKKKT